MCFVASSEWDRRRRCREFARHTTDRGAFSGARAGWLATAIALGDDDNGGSISVGSLDPTTIVLAAFYEKIGVSTPLQELLFWRGRRGHIRF
jgi:hypothetical protein